MKTLILGASVQGLIAAGLLSRAGIAVHVVEFPEPYYNEFEKGYKTGPVIHVPFALSKDVVDALDLESHGLEIPSHAIENPFKKLPFYDGLTHLLKAFQSLDDNKPAYKEKAWRDTWGTFELGRILSGYDADVQSLFAKSTTLSLADLLAATSLDDAAKAQIMANCVMGSKTDADAKGSAAAILPAMAAYEDEGSVMIAGSVHSLLKSLKQAAMSYGAEFHEGKTIQSVELEGGAIESVTLNDDEKLTADYYCVDCDPAIFFEKYSDLNALPPAFRNRVAPSQNLCESIHVQMVLSQCPDALRNHHIVAPSPHYMTEARTDFKKDGGSQLPMVSIVNVTDAFAGFIPDGQFVFDILAHYFDPSMAENESTREAQILVVIQALDKEFPGIADHIIHSNMRVMNTQGGQANFMGGMPLLQLFKIFFGHHAIGYDAPYHNLLIAGYGAEACAHYHVHKGGVRVASLLQSLKNNDKT